MKAVLQRVSRASVRVEGEIVGAIELGWLVLLGVEARDTDKDVAWLVDRIVGLRAFADENGRMNLSLVQVSGSLLVVSQFTLMADCRSGRRPSFDAAAPPDRAVPLYESFVALARSKGLAVETGVFGAMMDVDLVNAGPVTFILESPA